MRRCPQIAASIAEFGFNNPVLVDTNAGIIAGHGRVLAARKLGLDQVPVVVLDHLSETQKRAYILADNRIGENAGWDDEILRGELTDLKDADLDVALLGLLRRRSGRASCRGAPGRGHGEEKPRKRSPRCQSSRSRDPATSGSSGSTA